MIKSHESESARLLPGATVAVVGGGPAGAFFALHLLRLAEEHSRPVRVVIFERRRTARTGTGTLGNWRGCNFCAGGLSPKLMAALRDLGLEIPSAMIQGRVNSITIEGYWKNIEIDVPEGREIVSVYRGSQPAGRDDRAHSFDSFLLEQAVERGAEVVSAEVETLEYSAAGKPVIGYRTNGRQQFMEVEFAAIASGVNQASCIPGQASPMLQALRAIIPGYVPPRLRSALIFELEVDSSRCAALDGQLHFVEYGSQTLKLEMCSLLPKRGFITAVLVGDSIDAVRGRGQNAALVRDFLELPHIRKLLGPGAVVRVGCSCNPNMVVGNARNPVGTRLVAIGDLVTSRLYKDGILSAHETARAVAETIFTGGLEARDVRRGYMPTLKGFRKDNRFAAAVFLLHRIIFSSSVLSRVLYQAVITERKNTLQPKRRLERMLWEIASGDARYEKIFWTMLHPANLWQVLSGGAAATFRNYLTEVLFGLRWEGFGRFTTGVAKERLRAKRAQFARTMEQCGIPVPPRRDFERMYTIKIMAPCQAVFEELGRFGEADRRYLRPRWLAVERVAGKPNEPGCVIRYTVVRSPLQFHLELDRVSPGALAVYRVRDGFARGGLLIFEIEDQGPGVCALSIYVTFSFGQGRKRLSRPFWRVFGWVFPAFVHDVLWNHSLCVLKDVVETEHRSALCPEPKAPQLRLSLTAVGEEH